MPDHDDPDYPAGHPLDAVAFGDALRAEEDAVAEEDSLERQAALREQEEELAAKIAETIDEARAMIAQMDQAEIEYELEKTRRSLDV